MTNKPFDPTKPYRRRDGKPAKIVHTFNIDTYLVIVEHNFPDEAYYQVGLSGRYLSGTETGKDLINIPEKIEGGWINIYRDGSTSSLYNSKERADRYAAKDDRVACIKVYFTEGEGLND